MSFPGAFPVIRVSLSASAPYLSMTSSGSIPFPRDFEEAAMVHGINPQDLVDEINKFLAKENAAAQPTEA